MRLPLRIPALLVSLAAVPALIGGCAPESTRPTRPAPLLVIGVDGFEWDVLLPLMKSGRCPNLAALVERGRYGLLETFRPTARGAAQRTDPCARGLR